jgi:hypothetical protein
MCYTYSRLPFCTPFLKTLLVKNSWISERMATWACQVFQVVYSAAGSIQDQRRRVGVLIGQEGFII